MEPDGTPDPGNSPPVEPVVTDPPVDWQKRFTDTQAAYTQSQQELANARKLMDGEDPDALKTVLERYGYSIEDDQPEPDFGESVPDPRLDQFEQWMNDQQNQQAQQTTQAEWDGWSEFIATEAKNAGVELSAREVKGLKLDSIDKDGLPVEPDQAKRILQSYLDEERPALVEQLTKKRPRAPHVPSGGSAATGGKEFHEMTPQERMAWQLARVEAESA